MNDPLHPLILEWFNDRRKVELVWKVKEAENMISNNNGVIMITYSGGVAMKVEVSTTMRQQV